MLHWLPTLILSVFVLLFSVAMLAFAVYIEVLIAGRVVMNLYRLEFRKLPGTLAVAVTLGLFAIMFGSGAYRMASAVIAGLIERFL